MHGRRPVGVGRRRAGWGGDAVGGLHVSRIDGSPMTFNEPEPKLPDQLVCRPELADQLLRAIARQF